MRRHLPFLLILVATAIVRFVILFVSQTHVTSDEAIIGLMAKHILEGRAFPFYFYGISYNASCAWEAYLAVVPFAIAGVGVVALKDTNGFIVARLSRPFLHDGCATLFNSRGDIGQSHLRALARLAEVALPAARLRVLLFVYSGADHFFLIIEKENIRRARDFFFFGLICGIAFWSMELLLITIAALWLLLFFDANSPLKLSAPALAASRSATRRRFGGT